MAVDGWYPNRGLTLRTTKYYARDIVPVRAIVLHIAEGFRADEWLAGPNTTASAHFVVKQGGSVTQLISINNRAKANGLGWDSKTNRWLSPAGNPIRPPWPDLIRGTDPNLYTISIEEEGFYNYHRPTAQRLATTKLVAWIGEQLKLKYVVGRTLIGHSSINNDTRRNCPGPYANLDSLAREANALITLATQPNTFKCLVITGPANVRNAKSLSSRVIYQISQGSPVNVIRTEPGDEVNQAGIRSNEWAVINNGYIWFPLLKRLG